MIQNISSGILGNIVLCVIFSSSIYFTILNSGFKGITSIVLLILFVTATSIIYHINTSKLEFNDHEIKLKGIIWSYCIEKTKIKSVNIVKDLEGDNTPKYRTNGISLFGYNSGKFRLNSNEDAFLLTNKSENFVIIVLEDEKYEKVIFSLEDKHVKSFHNIYF